MASPIKLNTPISEEAVRKLKVKDRVLLSGTIFSARDMAHKYLVENDDPALKDKLSDGIIYHLGPIVKKYGSSWKIMSAGPTTSSREEPYEAMVIENYKVRAIIGKGGMGDTTLKALSKFGAVYLHAVGGAAALLAKCVKEVKSVCKLEDFGVPEAIWELSVEDFPAIVSMDSYGNSLHKIILESSKEKAQKIMEGLL